MVSALLEDWVFLLEQYLIQQLHMSNSRHNRRKTDFSHSAEAHSRVVEVRDRLKTPSHSTISDKRQSIFTRVLSQINHEINYESLSLQDIAKEKEMLKSKARQMNSTLAKLIEKQWQRRNQEERINKKAALSREMGIDFHQMTREYIQNTHTIKIMDDQFRQHNQKLLLLTDPDSKMNLVRQIAESQLKIKQIRQQLGRIKKNKILRQREIVKVSSADRNQVNTLQLEYINLAKKTQFLINRSQKIQEELADSEFSHAKQKDYYEQLRHECMEIDKVQASPAANEHLRLLYQAHKKKLEAHSKRNQRDQDVKKRKYYALLLDFQRCKKVQEALEVKIYQKNEQIDRSNEQIRKLIDRLDKIKEEEEKKRKNRSITNFMLTEIPKERVALRIKNNVESQLQQSNSVDKKFKHNLNGPIVRKWNSRVLGSIVRQPKISQDINEIAEANSQSQSYFSLGRNRMKSSVIAGQIRRFQTEVSPSIQYDEPISLVSSRIEQAYPADFDE